MSYAPIFVVSGRPHKRKRRRGQTFARVIFALLFVSAMAILASGIIAKAEKQNGPLLENIADHISLYDMIYRGGAK